MIFLPFISTSKIRKRLQKETYSYGTHDTWYTTNIYIYIYTIILFGLTTCISFRIHVHTWCIWYTCMFDIWCNYNIYIYIILIYLHIDEYVMWQYFNVHLYSVLFTYHLYHSIYDTSTYDLHDIYIYCILYIYIYMWYIIIRLVFNHTWYLIFTNQEVGSTFDPPSQSLDGQVPNRSQALQRANHPVVRFHLHRGLPGDYAG